MIYGRSDHFVNLFLFLNYLQVENMRSIFKDEQNSNRSVIIAVNWRYCEILIVVVSQNSILIQLSQVIYAYEFILKCSKFGGAKPLRKKFILISNLIVW